MLESKILTSDITMLPASSFVRFNKKFQVDFVLVSNIPDDSSSDENYDEFSEKRLQRSIFLQNLRKEGLKVKTETLEESDLVFDLIYAPRKVLERYAEICKIKMPLKAEYCDSVRLSETSVEDNNLKQILEQEAKVRTAGLLNLVFGESSAMGKAIKKTFIPNLERLKV